MIEKQERIIIKETSDRIFYKNHPSDKVLWIKVVGYDGYLEVSFDGEKIYNLWTDYPDKLTPEQKELFDKENPYWADFFRD